MMSSCTDIGRRATEADCPSVLGAPEVPSDMPSTGQITRKWGSVSPRNLTLVCDPNTNKGLVESVFCVVLCLFWIWEFPHWVRVCPQPSPTVLT